MQCKLEILLLSLLFLLSISRTCCATSILSTGAKNIFNSAGQPLFVKHPFLIQPENDSYYYGSLEQHNLCWHAENHRFIE